MPQELLDFPPAYPFVGVYRLLTDPHVRNPIWAKCKHGLIRGVCVAGLWTFFTYGAQHFIVRKFLLGTPRFSGLSDDSLFGYKVPMATYATFIFMSSQISGIIEFFLARNLAIARKRAWDQTVASRGKSPDFWGPYVEEWAKPPKVNIGGWNWEKWVGGWIARYVIRNAIIIPLQLLVPFAGIPISAAIKAVSTSRTLHAPYFVAKKMTPLDIAVYMEEHKLDYYGFGFTAALLEMVPIVGIFCSISNRIGACMWAYDLEKRQHRFAAGELHPLPPRTIRMDDGSSVELRPATASGPSSAYGHSGEQSVVGSWIDGEEFEEVLGGSYVHGEGVVADKKDL